MDEAKSLVNMAVTALLTCLILGAVVGLITLGYKLWDSLERQDKSNKEIRGYATYTAYDDTIVKGQEVLAMIATTKGDPWVAVYTLDGPDSSQRNLAYMVCNTKIAGRDILTDMNKQSPGLNNSTYAHEYWPVFKDESTSWADVSSETEHVDLTHFWNDLVSRQNGSDISTYLTGNLTNIWTVGSNNLPVPVEEFITDAGANNYKLDTSIESNAVVDTYTYLQKRMLLCGKNAPCHGSASATEAYTNFLSELVYADDNSGDIIGIVFVELKGKDTQE